MRDLIAKASGIFKRKGSYWNNKEAVVEETEYLTVGYSKAYIVSIVYEGHSRKFVTPKGADLRRYKSLYKWIVSI